PLMRIFTRNGLYHAPTARDRGLDGARGGRLASFRDPPRRGGRLPGRIVHQTGDGTNGANAALRRRLMARVEGRTRMLGSIFTKSFRTAAHVALVASTAGSALALMASLASTQPAPSPAPATPAIVPPVPASTPDQEKLRVVPAKRLPGKVHLLPATMETTQWGWFNNAQPPVLHVNSGDTIVFETMMHSHNQVVPGVTIEQIKKLRTDFPGR